MSILERTGIFKSELKNCWMKSNNGYQWNYPIYQNDKKQSLSFCDNCQLFLCTTALLLISYYSCRINLNECGGKSSAVRELILWHWSIEYIAHTSGPAISSALMVSSEAATRPLSSMLCYRQRLFFIVFVLYNKGTGLLLPVEIWDHFISFSF